MPDLDGPVPQVAGFTSSGQVQISLYDKRDAGFGIYPYWFWLVPELSDLIRFGPFYIQTTSMRQELLVCAPGFGLAGHLEVNQWSEMVHFRLPPCLCML